MGHSGSGKSTLMNILGCLDRPTLGHYYLDGIDTAALSPDELSAVRNKKIGFVFQSFNLISRTSALKNVELPMTYARIPKKKRTERAMELLDCVGLGARAGHMPNEMSGGQRQRVAIARALANEPPLILADEPTGNLDTAASIEIMEIFAELHKAGATVIVVTHEENIAAFTDRIIHFSDGQIIKDEINENPTKGSGELHMKGLYRHFREAAGTESGVSSCSGENMVMAFHAIMANKMRSFLTMLGIIIGIGSVISIVSIGDTMRGLFADLYKDAGTTQAVVSIGYWVEDVRDSDYFTLDDLEKIREVFADEIAYIDSYASVSPDVRVGRTSMKFDLQGVDRDYQEVQPVTMVAGRYLNESDILGRKKNVVMEAESAGKLFGTEDAVGKTFRTTIYGDTDLYTVVGVYKKEMSAFQKLLMGGSSDTGSAYIPYTLLTWPNDTFYYCRLYAKEGTDMVDLMSRLTAYLGKLKGRNAGDFYTNTVADEMGSIDSMMGGLSMAVGGIAAISLIVGGIGIMNIMLVSVTERTREIGIRKALGARTRDVLIQFLTESAILSALGGIIGVVLAVTVVTAGGAAFGLPAVIRPGIIILAVSFSAVVGIFFGIYPASKAAKADPIDALRYE